MDQELEPGVKRFRIELNGEKNGDGGGLLVSAPIPLTRSAVDRTVSQRMMVITHGSTR